MKRNIMVTKAAYTYIYRRPLTGNMADDIARALGHSSHSIVHAWDTIWIANWRGWGGAAVVISAMVELAAERAVVCWTVVRDPWRFQIQWNNSRYITRRIIESGSKIATRLLLPVVKLCWLNTRNWDALSPMDCLFADIIPFNDIIRFLEPRSQLKTRDSFVLISNATRWK